jgi:5-(carboxyamino)imidazole ribonucleotide synthase
MSISKKIGVLGGGQLGKMLFQASLDLDLDLHFLENDCNCPCANISKNFVLGDLNDFDTVYHFGQQCDIITIEIENVNVEALKKLEEEGKKVYPQPHILENIKNKCLQKRFFVENQIPTADFILVKNKKEIAQNSDFLPAVNKVAIGGYDGKGVQVIRDKSQVGLGFDCEGLLEKLIKFDKEIAVVVARNANGQIEAFPVVEMVFHPEANLVEYLFSPAHLSEDTAAKAKEIAIAIAQCYGVVGLLAVEMFLTQDGQILVNEVAPRPHNSAHHTQKANFTSQFDQHLRAILNLPLGHTREIGASAMVNLLGEPGFEGSVYYQGLEEILNIENVFPFFYGKTTTKPFRKMGHVTILEDHFDNLQEKVKFVRSKIKVISK